MGVMELQKESQQLYELYDFKKSAEKVLTGEKKGGILVKLPERGGDLTEKESEKS